MAEPMASDPRRLRTAVHRGEPLGWQRSARPSVPLVLTVPLVTADQREGPAGSPEGPALAGETAGLLCASRGSGWNLAAATGGPARRSHRWPCSRLICFHVFLLRGLLSPHH